MLCPKCGQEIRDTASLCIHCGTILKRRDGVVSIAGSTPDRHPSPQQEVKTPPVHTPPVPTPPVETRPVQQRTRKKKKAPIVPIVAALMAVAALVVVLLWHPWSPGAPSANEVTAPTVDHHNATTLPVVTTTTQPPVKEPESPSVQPPGYDKSGEPYLDDGILVMGDSAFECYNYVDSAAEQYASAINRTAAALQGASNVYTIVVPTSIGVCVEDDVRINIAGTDNQKDAIQSVYGKLSPSVKTVDTFDAIKAGIDQNEYLYFRTDTHWTVLGAYRTYEQFAGAIGVSPVPLSEFKEHKFPGYLGYLHYAVDNNAAMEANPDVVYAYEPKQTNTITFMSENGDTSESKLISDRSESDDKYLTFIDGDNPVTRIVNPEAPQGTSCVLIKESFGNAFAPFLVSHYHTVYVIDMRKFAESYQSTLVDFVMKNQIGDVIFLANLSATRNGDMLDALSAMCP